MVRRPCASLVLVVLAIAACIGPTRKPQPILTSPDAPNTQFVLEESYYATMDGVVVHLPYGVYPAAFEDKRGVYYRAPYPIKRKRLLFGSERLVGGGIYVPNSTTQRSLGMLWVYLRDEEGKIEVHLLPGPIHSGEGRLWHIEPRFELVHYVVRAECLGAVPSGKYELVLPDGTIEVVGAFANGLRDGVFTIYRSDGSGEKVAEIPYVSDQISGTVYLWYGPEYGSGRKLATQYVSGQLDGRTEAWYPDGTVRERSTYVNGVLEGTEFRDERGHRRSDTAAQAQAESAREADRQYLSAIDEILREKPPSCPAR